MPGPASVVELTEMAMSVDQRAIDAYARITNDFNPIHIDPEFAAATPMGGVIAHGTMSLGLMWQMIALNLKADPSSIRMTVRFVSPVRPGDRIVAGGQRDAHRGRHEVWVRNQRGEVVISGHIATAGSGISDAGPER